MNKYPACVFNKNEFTRDSSCCMCTNDALIGKDAV